jgi:hypothetical protein
VHLFVEDALLRAGVPPMEAQPKNQRLIFAGKQLETGRSLAAYSIQVCLYVYMSVYGSLIIFVEFNICWYEQRESTMHLVTRSFDDTVGQRSLKSGIHSNYEVRWAHDHFNVLRLASIYHHHALIRAEALSSERYCNICNDGITTSEYHCSDTSCTFSLCRSCGSVNHNIQRWTSLSQQPRMIMSSLHANHALVGHGYNVGGRRECAACRDRYSTGEWQCIICQDVWYINHPHLLIYTYIISSFTLCCIGIARVVSIIVDQKVTQW